MPSLFHHFAVEISLYCEDRFVFRHIPNMFFIKRHFICPEIYALDPEVFFFLMIFFFDDHVTCYLKT